MLVVKIELWPHGDEDKKETLGTAYIANDATGDRFTGNYLYRLLGKKKVLSVGRIIGFKRLQKNAWNLLKLVIEQYELSRT